MFVTVSKDITAFPVSVLNGLRSAQFLLKLGLWLVVAVFPVSSRKVTLILRLQDVLQPMFHVVKMPTSVSKTFRGLSGG